LLISNEVTNSSNHWSNDRPQACDHHPYQDMDQLITFNEAAAEFLKNHPTLAPCSDFAKIRALCKHINTALMQLVCPQSQIQGWAGLAMEPNMYALLKAVPFAIPINPGDTPVYMQFATPSHIKMADAIFLHNNITTCPTRTSTVHASIC
jgi:hypothetical protein